ncbi:Pickpocket protein 28 [Folsomia candida]|uniref:Pickpocket protein 28 n=2 Tax=Folsomia candida TaxID=158441 RepID=A0A226E4A6_FOLCA|nr:Pickpocket protein 28 [Folsomia candida]
MNEEQRNISPEDLESWKKFNLDDALMEKVGRGQKEKFPRRQSKAGQSSGLSLLLYPAIDEYFCASHDAYGYRIYAHSPIEIPHVLDFGLAVGPNTEMFINVQAEVTIAEKSLDELTSEERHCYFLDEKKLANYLLYTSTNCIDECIMERTVNACDCVTFEMYQSTVNKKPYCANLTCADNVRKQIGMKGTKYFCKACYPSCNRIVYDTQTSSLPIRTDVNIWKSNDPEKRMDWSKQNTSIVHVYFGSDSVLCRVRKRLFGFSELFANVGGILGLFIGFSVISVVEPIYYIIRLLTVDDEDAEDELET